MATHKKTVEKDDWSKDIVIQDKNMVWMLGAAEETHSDTDGSLKKNIYSLLKPAKGQNRNTRLKNFFYVCVGEKAFDILKQNQKTPLFVPLWRGGKKPTAAGPSG